MATGHAERDMLSPELRAVLETLTQDARNNVFVVSGKEQPAVVQVGVVLRYVKCSVVYGCFYSANTRLMDQNCIFVLSFAHISFLFFFSAVLWQYQEPRSGS